VAEKYIDSPKLIQRESDGYCFHSTDEDWLWYFCRSTVMELFNIPKSAKQIQFRAYMEPGEDRFKVHFKKVFENRKLYPFVETGEGPEFMVDDTENEIFKLLGRKRRVWYIKVFYWN